MTNSEKRRKGITMKNYFANFWQTHVRPNIESFRTFVDDDSQNRRMNQHGYRTVVMFVLLTALLPVRWLMDKGGITFLRNDNSAHMLVGFGERTPYNWFTKGLDFQIHWRSNKTRMDDSHPLMLLFRLDRWEGCINSTNGDTLFQWFAIAPCTCPTLYDIAMRERRAEIYRQARMLPSPSLWLRQLRPADPTCARHRDRKNENGIRVIVNSGIRLANSRYIHYRPKIEKWITTERRRWSLRLRRRGRFLSNTTNPYSKYARMYQMHSYHAWCNGPQAMEFEWQMHMRWINENMIASPKSTPHYTTRKLENMDMVGVYRRPEPLMTAIRNAVTRRLKSIAGYKGKERTTSCV